MHPALYSAICKIIHSTVMMAVASLLCTAVVEDDMKPNTYLDTFQTIDDTPLKVSNISMWFVHMHQGVGQWHVVRLKDHWTDIVPFTIVNRTQGRRLANYRVQKHRDETHRRFQLRHVFLHQQAMWLTADHTNNVWHHLQRVDSADSRTLHWLFGRHSINFIFGFIYTTEVSPVTDCFWSLEQFRQKLPKTLFWGTCWIRVVDGNTSSTN